MRSCYNRALDAICDPGHGAFPTGGALARLPQGQVQSRRTMKRYGHEKQLKTVANSG